MIRLKISLYLFVTQCHHNFRGWCITKSAISLFYYTLTPKNICNNCKLKVKRVLNLTSSRPRSIYGKRIKTLRNINEIIVMQNLELDLAPLKHRSTIFLSYLNYIRGRA